MRKGGSMSTKTREELGQDAEANARLIAAAPELLAAVEQWEVMLAADCTDGKTLNAVRALIAKARGRGTGR